MNSMFVRFVSGKGWDSKIIEWYSRCEWSHVELVTPAINSITFGAQLKGGVQWRSEKDPCYAKAAKFETWEIPITPQQSEMLIKLLDNAEGTPYDWPAILSFALGPNRLHLKGRYICSGFLAGILKSLELAVIDMPIENYEPVHIRMLVPNIPGAKRKGFLVMPLRETLWQWFGRILMRIIGGDAGS